MFWGAGLEEAVETTLALPAGTVTFLMTDIEGSTRLWEANPEAMAQAVPMHYALLSEAIGSVRRRTTRRAGRGRQRPGSVRPSLGRGAGGARGSAGALAARVAGRHRADGPDRAAHCGGTAARRGQLLRRRIESLRAAAGDRARRTDAPLARGPRPGRRAGCPRAPRWSTSARIGSATWVGRSTCSRSLIRTCPRRASRCGHLTACRTTFRTS